MIREVKFRLYTKGGLKDVDDRGVMKNTHGVKIRVLMVPGGGVAMFMNGELDEEWTDDSQYHVMVNTSIHDKNGTEIYDGDKLKYKEKTGEVIYRSGCFWFKDKGGALMLEAIRNKAEVVGNRYDGL